MGSLSTSFRFSLPDGKAALWLVLAIFLPHSIAGASASPLNDSAIPLDQIGAVAAKQCQGDGLSVRATDRGAQLRCRFQRMEGEITSEGLWLTSTPEESKGERFRVAATSVGRAPNVAQPLWLRVGGTSTPRGRAGGETPPESAGVDASATRPPCRGTVNVADKVVRFIRP